MDKEEEKKEFTLEYVKELREESATWRKKFRELETKLAAGEVEKELMKRGVVAEPSWVQVAAEQSVSEAVDLFVEKYPHLVAQKSEGSDESAVEKPRSKSSAPMGAGRSKTTVPGPKPEGKLYKSIEEIKKDPKSREALKSQYRQLLAQSSNKAETGE